MGQQLSLPEENHDTVRRILGMHDHGEDVISLQHALNRQLYARRKYQPIMLTWKLLCKRLTPTLWGYSWAPGALQEHLKHHVNPFKHWKPNPHVPKAARLKEDGKFGKKTREAVINYQHKDGLPDMIVLGPQIPGRNGLDVAREIARFWPGIPILMITVHMPRQLEAAASGGHSRRLRQV